MLTFTTLSSFFLSQNSRCSIPRRLAIFITFHPSISTPTPTSRRMMLLTLGASSSLSRMMSWHTKLEKKVRTDSPSRLVRAFQKPTSFLKARKANTECSVPTTVVMAHILQDHPISTSISLMSSTSCSGIPHSVCMCLNTVSICDIVRNMPSDMGWMLSCTVGSAREMFVLNSLQCRLSSVVSSNSRRGPYTMPPSEVRWKDL
mmetsp:Transcript_11487/g.21790  ORF Transcript_11487/g.21790 Transcript_11487/m.21790 type:complete len:203 (+) Transcript_11487:1123-1731(+)